MKKVYQKEVTFLRLWRSGFHFYFLGIIILTLGIAFSIQSFLGTSPFDALLVGLYRTFGLSIGSWEIVVGLTMIMGNALIERKRPEYFAILTSLITGIGIDTWMLFLSDWMVPQTWFSQYIFLIVGIVLTALGVATYLQSEIAPNPLDRSMLIISKITGWSVSYARALINVILVMIAFLFDGAIGIGTLINAIIAGIFINLFLPYLRRARAITDNKWLINKPKPSRVPDDVK